MSKVRLNCNYCGHFFWVKNCRKNKAEFCKRECYHESRKKRIILNCHRCNTSFERIPSEYKKDELPFCTRECYNAFRDENKIYKECLYCQSSFYTTSYDIKKGYGLFCGHPCSLKYTWETNRDAIKNKKLYPKTAKLRACVKSRKDVTNLKDYYIASQLGMSVDQVSDELIELKRVQLIAHRQSNNNLKITKKLCQNVKSQQMIL